MIGRLQKVAAAQATLRLYADRPLEWRVWDCGRMVAHHIAQFGHFIDLDRFGGYQTERGALKAIRKAGFEDLAAAMDSFGIERIAPAQAMSGDVIGWAADGKPMLALSVALGNGRILGFHPELGTACVQAAEFDRAGLVAVAWRL